MSTQTRPQQTRTKKPATKFFGPAAMSFPTWAYAVFFFIIPLALIVFYSFGYKPDEFTAIATDHLSFDRYPEAMTSSFVSTFFATLRISILGTILCLLIALPFAYWLAIKVSPARRSLALALVMVPFWFLKVGSNSFRFGGFSRSTPSFPATIADAHQDRS